MRGEERRDGKRGTDRGGEERREEREERGEGTRMITDTRRKVSRRKRRWRAVGERRGGWKRKRTREREQGGAPGELNQEEVKEVCSTNSGSQLLSARLNNRR